jgi:peptidoglycan-N-acetylglucosamine deacetylase
MLNYKTASPVFVFLLAALIVGHFFCEFSVLLIFIPPVLYAGMLSWGAKAVCSQFYMRCLCKAGHGEKGIAVTFDDGPSEYTPLILDILKEYDVNAAFFCVGKNMEKYPAVFSRIDQEGHVFANHSYFHQSSFDLKTSSRMLEELKMTHHLAEKLTGKKMKLFRPPFGVTNPPLRKAVDAMNYTAVGWSLRSYDTTKMKRNRIILRLKRKLKHGDIVLFHDDRKDTPHILKEFLEYAKHNKFEIKRLDILLNIQAYESEIHT